MKIYLGLLLLVVCIRAQDAGKKGSAPQQVEDPGEQVPGPQDFPSVNFLGENAQQEETSPPNITPGRSVRPGTLRKRTRTPRPSVQTSTEAYADFTDGTEDEYETTTQSEYAILTKNLTFDCSEHHPGFYANVETHCRIWHYCYGAIRYDNICPILTLFDQEFTTCVYAADTDCSKAPNFYDNNKKLYITTKKPGLIPKQKRRRPSTLPASVTTEPSSPDYEVDLSHSASLPRTKTS